MKPMINKYTVNKISPPDVPTDDWFEIPIDAVATLFNDERYTGEIIHLYNPSEDGAESLIDSDEKLEEALAEAREDKSPVVIHVNDLYAQQELFEIRELANND